MIFPISTQIKWALTCLHPQQTLIQTERHPSFLHTSFRRIFYRTHLLKFRCLSNCLGLMWRWVWRGEGGEGLTGVKDILIKFIVVPAKDMVLLLHMLLIAAKMLPTNLAIVRRRNSRLHQTPHTWRDNLPRLREQLSQSLLEVNPVALQFALLCFLFKTRLTVSVSTMKAEV